MGVESALGITSDTGEDLVRRFGPNERRGIFIVYVDVLANRGLQFLYAAKHAAANAFVGEFGEPSLDQVDPGTIGGCEVNMKPRALGQPLSDDRRFVRTIVIQDEMDIEAGGHLRLDPVQKPAELRRTMTAMQLADHPAGLQLKCRKQRGRPVTFVIVCAPLQLTWLQRQERLRTVKRLNLALLVNAEYQGVIRWVHIQAHDVAHFFDQQRVGREFEAVGSMRLQTESVPDPADGHPTEPGGFRQTARGPV